MKALALLVLLATTPAFAAKESKTTQAGNAISEAWGNTKKLVSKKKKENCRTENGKEICGEKLKKQAKKEINKAKS